MRAEGIVLTGNLTVPFLSHTLKKMFQFLMFYIKNVKNEFDFIVFIHCAGIVSTADTGRRSTHTVVVPCLLSNVRK